MRGATSAPTSNSNGPTDFNPRSSCEERLGLLEQHRGRLVISIHAPHARSDNSATEYQKDWAISIHAPHARSDQMQVRYSMTSCHFNPRSSCEERRLAFHMVFQCTRYFNPRSSCEERQQCPCIGLSARMISIHAPHARSDVVAPTIPCFFYSISIYAPHARSDRLALQPYARLEISIHAPHARSDCAEICIIDDTIISIHAPHARSDSAGIRGV